MFVLLLVIMLVLLYVFVAHGWINTWGATPAEVKGRLPGDKLLPLIQGQSTRAITIHAPPEKIWQWLVQIGQGRGGFFSYDWLENLFGLDIHTVHKIVPELQHLEIGDQIRFGKNGPIYLVAALEPQRTLILRMPNQKTLKYPDPDAPDYYDATWGFILNPVDEQTTRFIIRGRGVSNTFSGRLMNGIIGPISFIMEQKMLRGIKSRAERAAKTATA